MISVSVESTSYIEREQAIDFDYTLGRRLAPEAERVIDEDPPFRSVDQTGPANRMTRVIAESDGLPTINDADAGARIKRETSRTRRNCEQNAENCKMLLKTMQSYLMALSNRSSGGNTEFINRGDILNCLRCKNVLANVDPSDKESPPQSKDQYFPHDYTEQNRSGDFGITVVKLLDDRGIKDGSKHTEVDGTEAPKIQTAKMDSVQNNASPNAGDQSAKISEAITVSSITDHTDSNVTDGDENSTANASGPPTKIQSNESASPASYVDRGATAASMSASNGIVWQISTTEPSATQSSAITMNDAISTTIVTDATGSTEMSTQNSINPANHTAIIENVTSVPVGYNVTGLDNDNGTLRPSVQPPFDGHPENQSAAGMNGT